LWEFETDDWGSSSPALADLDGDGVVDCVVGSDDRKVYALSGRTGRPLPVAAARAAILHSNFAAAERIATDALASSRDPALLLARAEARWRQGNFPGAIEDIEAAHAAGLTTPEAAAMHVLACAATGVEEPDLALISERLRKHPPAFLAVFARAPDAQYDAAALRSALEATAMQLDATVDPNDPWSALGQAAVALLLEQPPPQPRWSADPVVNDYWFTILGLAAVLGGREQEAAERLAMGPASEPGRRFRAIWSRRSWELRLQLRPPPPRRR
jgi:hypothetical protein